MRDRWKRWRGYFEELEEVARLAGQHLSEVESQLRSEHERDYWPAAQQETVATELVAFVTPTVVEHPSDNDANFNQRAVDRLGDFFSKPLDEFSKEERQRLRERITTPALDDEITIDAEEEDGGN